MNPSEDTLKQTSVRSLQITERSANCLEAVGIKTVADVIGRSDHELMTTPNLGRKSVNELKAALTRQGLALKPDGNIAQSGVLSRDLQMSFSVFERFLKGESYAKISQECDVRESKIQQHCAKVKRILLHSRWRITTLRYPGNEKDVFNAAVMREHNAYWLACIEALKATYASVEK
jgi:Bacterial RNA polymerase, alpha chain C terminal domain